MATNIIPYVGALMRLAMIANAIAIMQMFHMQMPFVEIDRISRALVPVVERALEWPISVEVTGASCIPLL